MKYRVKPGYIFYGPDDRKYLPGMMVDLPEADIEGQRWKLLPVEDFVRRPKNKIAKDYRKVVENTDEK